MNKTYWKLFQQFSSVVAELLNNKVAKQPSKLHHKTKARMAIFTSTKAFIGLILSVLFLSTAQSAKVEKYELKYYDEFLNFTKNFNSNGKIVNFFFYGEKNITVC
jgi:hypothetical protein